MIVAGVSGTFPGIPLVAPAVIPVNPDALSILVFRLTFAPGPFDQPYPRLDADREAQRALTLAPGLTTWAVGANLDFAFFLMPPRTMRRIRSASQ